MGQLRVIGDIGGTNARFALASDGAYRFLQYLAVADYPSFQDALGAYLGQLPDALRPEAGAFAVAGPVADGRAVLTSSRFRILVRVPGQQDGVMPSGRSMQIFPDRPLAFIQSQVTPMVMLAQPGNDGGRPRSHGTGRITGWMQTRLSGPQR